MDEETKKMLSKIVREANTDDLNLSKEHCDLLTLTDPRISRLQQMVSGEIADSRVPTPEKLAYRRNSYTG